MEDIIFFGGKDTTQVVECINKMCGFNRGGKCTASGTECFGYMEPVNEPVLVVDANIPHIDIIKQMNRECRLLNNLNKVDTSFRNGSRGKGGKIKYRRK